MQTKIIGNLLVLKEKGYLVREPYPKYIVDGIFEFRIIVGNNISRILYFFYVGERIILTNGFVKKTNKTPMKEIELAKKYRNDCIERNSN